MGIRLGTNVGQQRDAPQRETVSMHGRETWSRERLRAPFAMIMAAAKSLSHHEKGIRWPYPQAKLTLGS
jgi:hypothetical protein